MNCWNRDFVRQHYGQQMQDLLIEEPCGMLSVKVPPLREINGHLVDVDSCDFGWAAVWASEMGDTATQYDGVAPFGTATNTRDDEAGTGAIITTANTSALRGKANFAGFAPTKAAQRILAEAIAREVGPKGVHVAYVVIDAVIDLAWTRQMMRHRLGKDALDKFFIQPLVIAEEIWHVAHQDRSAWSFNVEIRPFGETW